MDFDLSPIRRLGILNAAVLFKRRLWQGKVNAVFARLQQVLQNLQS